ncbi:MAG: hypoxanthine phosphoribosyltransferase [Nitrospinota bacterium]
MEEPLIPREEIGRRVAELAQRLREDYGEEPLHLVVILKGAIFFAVDLIRALGRPVTLGFVSAASYGAGTESSGEVKLNLEALGAVEGRHVLVVEDILDTGLTLAKVKEAIAARAPRSLRLCVLLEKPARKQVPIEADYLGFQIGDRFVVGYGLDHAERHRELPDIRALGPEGRSGHRAEA